MKRLLGWVLAFAALIAVGVLGWWLMHASTAQENDSMAVRALKTKGDERPLDDEPFAPFADRDGGLVRRDDAGAFNLSDDDEVFVDAGADLLEFRRMLAKNAEQATRNVDKFCELSRRVSKMSPAPAAQGSHDAALYLSSRIDWEGGVLGSLHLPKSLTDRMSAPPDAWWRMEAADYAGLDFGWLTELLGYDTWALSTTGPLRDLERTNFLEAPIPNFVSLMHWAKLRFLKGALEADLARASMEVRHLAMLCGSTHLLIGDMIRFAIYGIERRFFEQLGQPAPSGLSDAVDGESSRRTVFAGMYFLYPGVPKAVRQKALTCAASRCSAMTEAIAINAAARATLPEAQEGLEWLLGQHPCDAELAARIAKSPPASDEVLAHQIDDVPSLDDLLTFDAGR